MPLVKIRTDEIAKELVPVFRAQEGGRSREGYLRFMKELRKRVGRAGVLSFCLFLYSSVLLFYSSFLFYSSLHL